MVRKGALHGFAFPLLAKVAPPDAPKPKPDLRISQAQMLRGNQHGGNGIRVFSVLYDGMLTVLDPDLFRRALQSGVGHGKALGLGLLSVAGVA